MKSVEPESNDEWLSLSNEQRWHHAIAVRAYRVWQREGEPQGVRSDGTIWAEHFWMLAEKQLNENGFN
jgi:Protein of unknown function (DUF2934)